MRIPHYHIKKEVERIDRYNEKVSKRTEKYHQSDREAVANEMADMGNSKSFKRDVERNKNKPDKLEKLMRKIYGEKSIPYNS